MGYRPVVFNNTTNNKDNQSLSRFLVWFFSAEENRKMHILTTASDTEVISANETQYGREY